MRTDTQTIVATHAVEPTRLSPSSAEPDVLQQELAAGYGASALGPGEPLVDRTSDGSPPPAPGPNRKRLLRFVHTADFQLADDESPTRLASLDGAPPLDAAFRPQEGYACRILNAVVRTIDRLHQDDPLDFVLLGGDNVDNAQDNELDWVLALLGGAPSLACDSGDADDPVPGPNNDGKDPFVPEGLAVPFYWVTGNHDVLVQGNFSVDDGRVSQATSDTPSGGTRDYRAKGAPVTRDPIVPDAKRIEMRRAQMIAKVSAHVGRAGPAGHGLSDYAKSSGKAFYTVDLGASNVRLLVLDTAAESGGSEGVLHQKDLDAFVRPELDRAKAEGKWVFLASHHATDRLLDGEGLGGTKQDDAVLGPAWERIVTSYPNVLASFVGHAHRHRVRAITPPAPSTDPGFWELQSAAIADFPSQFNVVELWDEDDGWLTLRVTAVNYATEGDPVAATGRTLGILDYTTGSMNGGAGTAGDRNVVVWRRKP